MAANIDPTKLKRAAFIAAASGWFLANFDRDRVLDVIEANCLRRKARMIERRRGLSAAEAANLARFNTWFEQGIVESMRTFVEDKRPRLSSTGQYRRNPAIKGPVSVFGYDYLEDKYGKERTEKLRLLLLPRGSEYAYEALNLVDGRRSIQQIRDDLSAIYGSLPLDVVTEYLQALESAGLIQPVRQ